MPVNEPPAPASAPRPEASGEPRTDAQRRLDHLFRHALKDEQVSPLYFLLQRFRARAGEESSP